MKNVGVEPFLDAPSDQRNVTICVHKWEIRRLKLLNIIDFDQIFDITDLDSKRLWTEEIKGQNLILLFFVGRQEVRIVNPVIQLFKKVLV